MREEEDAGGGRGGEDEHKGQRPLGCLSESLGMSFGSLLEASWGVLGASWRSQGLLGAFWVPRGSLLGPLGGILGGSWRPLGASWAPPGALLGPSWEPWRPSWGHLGGHRSKKGWILFPSPRRGLQMGLLGRSWGPLGALLGALGAFLGPSWASIGALLGHFGATLRPQKPIGSEKARRQTSLSFLRF